MTPPVVAGRPDPSGGKLSAGPAGIDPEPESTLEGAPVDVQQRTLRLGLTTTRKNVPQPGRPPRTLPHLLDSNRVRRRRSTSRGRPPTGKGRSPMEIMETDER